MRAISIHAPLAGRDQDYVKDKSKNLRFQSTRPSRGATRRVSRKIGRRIPFQSTRPSRGATRCRCRAGTGQSYFNPRAPRGARPVPPGTPRVTCSISIHAPLAGRDYRCDADADCYHQFQSTRPSRGATEPVTATDCPGKISIHAPLAGRDSKCAQKSRTYLH